MWMTTLKKIRSHSPCEDGWEKLLKHLGKTKADDDPLSIIEILSSNGLSDALWCLRAVDGHDREIRRYAFWCVRQVQNLMTDQRSIDALDVAERYANGLATAGELSAARAAASRASWAARAAASRASRSSWAALASAAAAGEIGRASCRERV